MTRKRNRKKARKTGGKAWSGPMLGFRDLWFSGHENEDAAMDMNDKTVAKELAGLTRRACHALAPVSQLASRRDQLDPLDRQPKDTALCVGVVGITSSGKSNQPVRWR